MGKLDEISLAIGRLQAEIRGVKDGVADVAQGIEYDREIADGRHSANQERLATIEKALEPLQTTVAKITPIVETIQITRWKWLGGMSVVGAIFGIVVWLLTFVAKGILAWLAGLGR